MKGKRKVCPRELLFIDVRGSGQQPPGDGAAGDPETGEREGTAYQAHAEPVPAPAAPRQEVDRKQGGEADGGPRDLEQDQVARRVGERRERKPPRDRVPAGEAEEEDEHAAERLRPLGAVGEVPRVVEGAEGLWVGRVRVLLPHATSRA